MTLLKEFLEFLDEERTSGRKYQHGLNWLSANGFELHRTTGKHPVFKHKDTGDTINGFNSHKGDISPDALRNTRKQVVAHHNKHGLTYISLDDKSL